MPGDIKDLTGFCRGCAKAYAWRGLPKMADALCPKCRAPLRRYMRRFHLAPIVEQRPAARELRAS